MIVGQSRSEIKAPAMTGSEGFERTLGIVVGVAASMIMIGCSAYGIITQLL